MSRDEVQTGDESRFSRIAAPSLIWLFVAAPSAQIAWIIRFRNAGYIREFGDSAQLAYANYTAHLLGYVLVALCLTLFLQMRRNAEDFILEGTAFSLISSVVAVGILSSLFPNPSPDRIHPAGLIFSGTLAGAVACSALQLFGSASRSRLTARMRKTLIAFVVWSLIATAIRFRIVSFVYDYGQMSAADMAMRLPIVGAGTAAAWLFAKKNLDNLGRTILAALLASVCGFFGIAVLLWIFGILTMTIIGPGFLLPFIVAPYAPFVAGTLIAFFWLYVARQGATSELT